MGQNKFRKMLPEGICTDIWNLNFTFQSNKNIKMRKSVSSLLLAAAHGKLSEPTGRDSGHEKSPEARKVRRPGQFRESDGSTIPN